MRPDEFVQTLYVILYSLIAAGATLWILIYLGIEGPRWRCQECGRSHRLPARGTLPVCCMQGLLDMMPDQNSVLDSLVGDEIPIVVLD